MKLDRERLISLTGLENIELFDCIPSTNAYLKQADKPVGSVAIAYSQTNGRGRLGRSFSSPKNGLYMSIVTEYSDMLTVGAAVAVAEVIEKYSALTPEIKWVNDIYIKGKKVCGILCEGIVGSSGNINTCVAGIGINLFEPEGGFDGAIENIAGCVFSGKEIDTTAFTAAVILKLFEVMKRENIAAQYAERLLYKGETVYYEKNGVRRSGTVLGVDNKCGLIVKCENTTEILRCGEVSIRKCEP